MAWNELADTLLQLVESVSPDAGSGLVVTEAELEMPLEVSSAVRQGRLVFCASAPHSRWKAGFLPPVHRTRIRVEIDEIPEDGRGR
ncbi:MAG: hypothetical protein ABUT39_28345 [Acidobacteriota bacterium]